MGLVDKNGNTVVSYTYDSWGKPLAITGSLASTLGADQPFRYRGYIYDNETGWYYLKSRYCNPSIGRFISADVLLSTGQGVLGHNAYAYCLNNPINRSDDAGNRASWLTSVYCYEGGGIYYQCPDPDPAPGEYIDNQSDPAVSDWATGWFGNISDNGCGLVALYNAMTAADKGVKFTTV